MPHPPIRRAIGAAAALLVAAGCGGSGAVRETTPAPSSTPGVTVEQQAAVAATYADLVLAAYDASLASATTMAATIREFLDEPTQATLDAAREAWLAARNDYGPTEAFRFYGGPIDAADDGPEGRINAWPLDEAYIDYVEGDPQAGIVNQPDLYPEITTDVLVEANEQGGETNISTGWHAIEFLLWGQDLNDDGPGQRPHTDYTTAPNAERRATYLALTTDLLLADLRSVRDAWDPATGSYRAEFLADPELALARILRGIGALSAGELTGERLGVAFETKDREDEHSCFSDNTNADFAANQTGIMMVYLGEGAGVSGPGLGSLVAAVDPALDATLRAQLAATKAAIDALPEPFERMIAGVDEDPGRVALADLLGLLDAQNRSLSSVGRALGLDVRFEI